MHGESCTVSPTRTNPVTDLPTFRTAVTKRAKVIKANESGLGISERHATLDRFKLIRDAACWTHVEKLTLISGTIGGHRPTRRILLCRHP